MLKKDFTEVSVIVVMFKERYVLTSSFSGDYEGLNWEEDDA